MPANASDVGSIFGWGKYPGKGGTHSTLLAWEIPLTEEPGGLQSMEYQELDMTW